MILGLDFAMKRFSPKHRRTSFCPRLERLEPRQLLDANPIISEFAASNDSSLDDGDGNSSDWIEIFNAGDHSLNLDGWRLTDNAANLTAWTFPSVELPAGEFLVVFASGQNREDYIDAGGNLHTDFKLNAGGEYLALVEPDGVTIASEFTPTFPPQVTDISYGVAMDSSITVLLTEGSAAEVLIPTDDTLGLTWTEPGFTADGSWITESSPGVPAATGVGFDTGTGVTSPDLVAAWSLDEDVGSTTVLDSSGGGHNGATAGAVTFGTNGAGATTNSAATFAGSGVIDIPFDAALNPESFTVTAWAKVTGGGGHRSVITSRYDGIVFGGGNLDGFIIYATPGNTWEFWTGDGESQADGWDVLSGPAVELNEWTHLAISFDAATSTKTFYVNGAQAATTTTQGYAPVTNAGRNLHIGSGGDAGDQFRFVGDIDDVGLFDTALDLATVQQIMAESVPDGASVDFSPLIGTDVEVAMQNVNASALVRVPFTVADPAAFDSLTLRMKYDDGFVAYLNGTEVARRNAPAVPAFDDAATGTRSDGDAISYETFSLTADLDKLVAGDNVLAIQGLNSTAGDDDFLILPELEAVASTVLGETAGYFVTPTPGSANPAVTDDIGPTIGAVAHTPTEPTVLDPTVVTAQVNLVNQPIETVSLVYRVMFGGELTVPMVDDGSGDDVTAGDGIYTGTIPAGVGNAGEMLRYYVTAVDVGANETRAPRITDTTGQDRSPEYFGTVVADPATASSLPIFQWFAPNPSAGHTRGGTRASVYYNGEFYDNIFARQRGQATNAFSQKFDFNDDQLFFVNDEIGRVEEINMNAQGRDPTFIRQTVAFEAWRDAGVPASESFLVRMEANGSFDRVGVYIEQVDDLFLERNGLDPDGALYKFVQRQNLNPVFSDTTTGIEKKTRRDEDFSDIQAVVDGLQLPTQQQRRDYIFDNFNIPEIVNYLAIRAIIQDADDIRKNFYFYRDTNGTGEWAIYPWDNDFTFGIRGDGGPNLDHPFFGEQEHLKLNANQWNVMLDVMFDVPETQEMYLRRLRTLMDEELKQVGPSTYETRIDEIFTQAAADLALQGVSQNTVNAIAPFFPEQRNDFFNTQSIDNLSGPGIVSTIVPEFTGARWFVPEDNSVTDWTGIADPVNIAQWGTGQTGIGYENSGANYAPLLKTTVEPRFGNSQGPLVSCGECTSTYVRIPFTIADQAKLDDITANGLTLRMKYDDGFVAFINGTEIARRNVGGTAGTLVSYDTSAVNHDDNAAAVFENININAMIGALAVGQNILAIQGVNTNPTSSDMLILPELVEGFPSSTGDVAGIPHEQADSPTIDFGPFEFNPASGNQDEEYISLLNPNDTAVDVSGWALSGGVEFTFRPGTVIPAGNTLYVSPDVNVFRARATGPGGGQGLFVQGGYAGHISNLGETINLLDGQGVQVATVNTPFSPSDVQQFLRVTELHYNPAGVGDATEFVELRNISSGAEAVTLDLAGVRITGGPSEPFDFTQSNVTSLAAGEYVLVVKDQAAFTAAYGSVDGAIIAGEFVGNLSNGGETIKIEDADNSTVAEFKYENGNDPITEADWHAETDGNGFSLVVIDVAADYDSGTNWRSSAMLGGSPGGADPQPLLGNFNGDFAVDRGDAVLLLGNLGRSGNSHRARGDANDDRTTSLIDLALLQSGLGATHAAPSAAPLSAIEAVDAHFSRLAQGPSRSARAVRVSSRGRISGRDRQIGSNDGSLPSGSGPSSQTPSPISTRLLRARRMSLRQHREGKLLN